MDLASLHDLRHGLEVRVRAVGARPHHHLVHLHAFGLGDRHHFVGVARERDERLDGAEIQLHRLIVGGVRVRQRLPPVLLASDPAHVVPGHRVRGEDRGRRAELRPHVADRDPLLQVEVLDPRADVLEHLAEPAVRGLPAQHLEDDVFGRRPRPERAGQADPHDRGHVEVVGPAAHRHRDVEPAGAHGIQPHAPHVHRVAVRPQRGVSGAGEVLLMDLVPDPRPRLRPPDAVLAGGRGEVHVVLGVLLADLQHVVVAVGAGHLAPHPPELHRLEVQHRGGPGDVLDEDLVDLDADLFAGRQAAVGEVRLQDLAGQILTHRTPLPRTWGPSQPSLPL